MKHGEMGQALLICGDSKSCRLAVETLESEGYRTVECRSVDEAGSMISALVPAVILVDADAGEREPLELCESIRRLPACDYIPLILISDADSRQSNRRAYDAGITAVFAKPLNTRALRKHIRSLGDTGRTLSGVRALRTPQSEVFRTIPDAFFIVGDDGLLRQFLGGGNKDPVLCPEEIEGQMVTDVWPAKISKLVLQSIRRCLRTRDGHNFEVVLAKGQISNSYEIRMLVQGRDRVLMIIRNITNSTRSSTGGRDGDSSDTLTGLTDRDAFMSKFESLIADARLRERGIATFCIDIDRFTRINETVGRAVGDAVLQVTAKRIQRCLRSSDQLAGIKDEGSSGLTRISGDEFVLVVADIESREDVSTVASRLQDAFEEPVSFEGHKLKISPSIGISMFPLDGDNATDLLKNARVALDEAKIFGVKGREFFSSTMKYRSLKRLDVKNELRWAIEKQQLELRYLPRIDLVSGNVAGLEALLRWMHPLRGSVPLSEVIPLAEATGLIFPIGEWVLITACSQTQAWRQTERNVPPVSINLSQQEFSRSDLVELVRKALEDSGLPADQLELELTESMLLRNRQAAAVLQDLNRIGVGLVLDDFGQGHSSLAHLIKLPIKAIKIDRAFIEGVREPGEKQSICSAMIAMSRELGLSVIAEGVESELQLEFLRDKGCDAVQGFLYSEPLPADEVPAFLTACREVVAETAIIDLDTVRKKIASKKAS
jgi:diguanylate cyclase (GGDEF)-like protein